MRAYSNDLRERVITALRAGDLTHAEIVEMFGISPSTLDKWWQRWRATHSCAAKPRAGGRQRVLRPCGEFLRAEVARQPDIQLDELCARVAAVYDVQVSPSMMCRELQTLHLPRKKSRSMTVSVIRRA